MALRKLVQAEALLSTPTSADLLWSTMQARVLPLHALLYAYHRVKFQPGRDGDTIEDVEFRRKELRAFALAAIQIA